MTTVKAFDLLNDPLEGTHLTEASAGTGKTYTITGLFLRLVLEKNLAVDQILVVTFTEAATQELKDRIRGTLLGAIQAFSGGRTEDSLLKNLVERHRGSKTAARHLIEAVRAFDQAAICTIHGFCGKMLYENAFESGSLFDTELVADQEAITREIVEDFWRTHFYRASPLFVRFALNKKVGPGSLASLLGNRVAQPYLRIIPEAHVPDTSPEEQAFLACFKDLCQAWPSYKRQVGNILKTHPGLNRNKYRHASIPAWLQGMDDYVDSGGSNPILFSGFEKFTSGGLAGAVKENHRSPTHPFFSLCEALKQKNDALNRTFGERLLGLKAALFSYARKELVRRKEEKNIQSFDDLLLRLHRALEDQSGEALARTMRTKYKAVLVDEFQDTDPIQYAIFKKAFGNGKGILFLIGDPKQAIYGFRNADIFAYMKAATHVQPRYTLAENWRSEPALITAINTVFAQAHHPFVYDGIPFQPVMPAPAKDRESLKIDGQSEPPLQVWFMDANRQGLRTPLSKGLARDLIPVAVAGEVSRLLRLGRDNRALLGKRPLKEGDIAVLVRRNVEARRMQEVLSGLHIPSVLYSAENLFDSHEALEMDRLLAALAEPNHERLVKAAVATDMMGLTGEVLDRLIKDETGWEDWPVRFRGYHDLWHKKGFIQMFRHLLGQERVVARLMSLAHGERRATNVLHLAEVLHQASVDKNLGMAGLLKWLSEQRDPRTPRREEHQLRLESDDNAVKLVTIHKSKGLEYPVCFCPFAWDGSQIRKSTDPFIFHNEADNRMRTLDLGSPGMDRNRVFAEKEQLAENLRLLYVALTRAKNRCYLVWGRFNEAETSALAYLFHQPESWNGRDMLSALGQRFMGLTDEALLAELESMEAKAHGTIKISQMPTDAGEPCAPSHSAGMTLACRRFSGSIDCSWHISSFSSLVTHQPDTADLADHDAMAFSEPHEDPMIMESTPEEEPSGIFAFPGGAKAGLFMHDIFEHLDFVQRDTLHMEKLVADRLTEYGFELTYQETLCDMIQKVLSLPLEPSSATLTLSRIGRRDRLNELEFYFPLKSISPKKLKNVFRQYGGPKMPSDFPERIERLLFSPVRGFMKGFMDMVFLFEGRFYLVDWKSNLLGNTIEAYGQVALTEAMNQAFYILQYHIYATALNQYLHLRIPGYNYETHFGAIYYIFLRGVDPDRGADFGIFRDRPAGTLINELCATLIDRNGS